MERKILQWFATGKVGTSSKAMACAAVDIPVEKGAWGGHPHDPADLNRCLLLLKEVPEIRDHFDKVAALSGTWAKLIKNWDKLESTFTEEVGFDWSIRQMAPKTYALMKSYGC